jgi:predicted nucleic acid-binding protein
MSNFTARADFFDASALVKVFADEPGSIVVREYWRSRATKYTTPFCFYEAMNVLKSKWKHKGQLTLPSYLEAAFELTVWYGASSSKVSDLDFTDPLTFAETKSLAERSGLDLSDAFQIMSVKRGYFSVLVKDSATVLVTADNALAEAARAEELRVWNINLEPPPQ